MKQPTDEQIAALLVGIISDGFNRSLNALEEAGAIDRTKLSEHYTGVGSKYYDLVSAQMELTAKYGVRAVHLLFADDNHPDIT